MNDVVSKSCVNLSSIDVVKLRNIIDDFSYLKFEYGIMFSSDYKKRIIEYETLERDLLEFYELSLSKRNKFDLGIFSSFGNSLGFIINRLESKPDGSCDSLILRFRALKCQLALFIS